jgi:hypothetical protein
MFPNAQKFPDLPGVGRIMARSGITSHREHAAPGTGDGAAIAMGASVNDDNAGISASLGYMIMAARLRF